MEYVGLTRESFYKLDRMMAEFGGGGEVELDSPTSVTLESGKSYKLTNVTSCELSYPSGSFDVWMLVEFGTGNVSLTLPEATRWVGDVPTFGAGETWELSIRDGIAVAGSVQ